MVRKILENSPYIRTTELLIILFNFRQYFIIFFLLIQTFSDDVSTTFPVVCDIYTKKDLNG